MLQQKNNKILCVYAESQTYTNTVYEHLCSFKKYSKYSWFYCDFQNLKQVLSTCNKFQVIVIHYSVRLPFGQINQAVQLILKNLRAIKVLFIQDEYDHTNATINIMKKIAFDLVFTVVPEASIGKIYSKYNFPKTRFVSNLTGYVPEKMESLFLRAPPPSKRDLTVGYRGRKLPIRYGRLAQEKFIIGSRVKNFCQKNNISCDIDWEEDARIYGKAWYRFICTAKAMLGTESGSNVFDWDNSIQKNISQHIKSKPFLSEEFIYKKFVRQHEVPGLMNQISPRIFEMAAGHTVMILFEGTYSGILKPDVHYLALKKNFKNLGQIFTRLKKEKIDLMAETAFDHLVASGKYSYREFVKMVDREIDQLIRLQALPPITNDPDLPEFMTEIHAFPKKSKWGQNWKKYFWLFLPPRLGPLAKKTLKHPVVQRLLKSV